MLKKFAVKSKEEHRFVDDIIEGTAIYHMGICYGEYAAETRGQAHAQFCKEYRLDWTEPVNIALIPDCHRCANEGYIDDDMVCPTCKGRCIAPFGGLSDHVEAEHIF